MSMAETGPKSVPLVPPKSALPSNDDALNVPASATGVSGILTGTDVNIPLTPVADAGTFNASSFDGSADFGGTSGTDFGPVSAMDMQSVTLTSAADLAAYSGAG